MGVVEGKRLDLTVDKLAEIAAALNNLNKVGATVQVERARFGDYMVELRKMSTERNGDTEYVITGIWLANGTRDSVDVNVPSGPAAPNIRRATQR